MSDIDAIARISGVKASKTFASAAFHRLQRRHFILFDVLPALGTLATLAFIPWLPPRPADLALFFVLWLVTGLGLTVGFHRYFSHRAFVATRPVALGLLAAGSMAARGPMMSWVAMHRRHHECADKAGDLHSPHAPVSGWRGFLHAHLAWMIRHDYPNVTIYAADLLRDRALQRWNRRYFLFVVAGLALPALLGGLIAQSLAGALTGFLWGGIVRLFVVEQTMSAVNSVCHCFGARPYAQADRSANNGWFSLLSWGESHHNNHHAAPGAAAFGRRWSEPDPGFWLIRTLGVLGFVSDIRQPPGA